MNDAQMTADPHHSTMPDTSELVAVAEVLAGLYDRLLAERLPTKVGEPVLDGLFDSIASIEKVLGGEVGPRARAVLGPMGAI